MLKTKKEEFRQQTEVDIAFFGFYDPSQDFERELLYHNMYLAKYFPGF